MVERSHRTWQGDVVTGVCFPDLAALQSASNQALVDRQCYLPSGHPSCQGQPPAQAYPDLWQPRRPYQPAQERDLFDLGRVDVYLAEWAWQRQVDGDGKISLANRSHRVSKAHRGQIVKVRFDAATREFVCTSVAQEELARLQLVEVSLDYILGEGV
jgi:hypothetical protein